MKILDLKIEGFRSLKSVSWQPGDVNVLIGPNAGGKSNLLNVILCTLIRRNPPESLKILMVDLKGGVELSFYEGIPHLITHIVETDDDGNELEITRSGIIESRKMVPPMLRWVIKEGESRLSKMKRAGFKDIGSFNRHKPKNSKNRLPHLMIVIDEWGDVSLDPGIKREANTALANIAQRFRAAGVHVIACTQYPNK